MNKLHVPGEHDKTYLLMDVVSVFYIRLELLEWNQIQCNLAQYTSQSEIKFLALSHIFFLIIYAMHVRRQTTHKFQGIVH